MKQQKAFKQLMLHRIKWDEGKSGKEHKEAMMADPNKPKNKCDLVWEVSFPEKKTCFHLVNSFSVFLGNCKKEKLWRNKIQSLSFRKVSS